MSQEGKAMTGMVHGHEVMRMMVSSGRAYTREELEQAILERFGPDTRFYTCSAQGMTASELVRFLEGRGKFIESGDGLRTAPDRICDH